MNIFFQILDSKDHCIHHVIINTLTKFNVTGKIGGILHRRQILLPYSGYFLWGANFRNFRDCYISHEILHTTKFATVGKGHQVKSCHECVIECMVLYQASPFV